MITLFTTSKVIVPEQLIAVKFSQDGLVLQFYRIQGS